MRENIFALFIDALKSYDNHEITKREFYRNFAGLISMANDKEKDHADSATAYEHLSKSEKIEKYDELNIKNNQFYEMMDKLYD